MPEVVGNLLKAYFQDIRLHLVMAGFTTGESLEQSLEIFIMAGCPPLAFAMAIEVIIRSFKWLVGVERHHLPPLRAYVNDMS